MADAARVMGKGNHVVKKAIKVIDTISTWIGILSSWLIIPLGCPLRFQPQVRRHQEIILPHQPQHPLLLDGLMLNNVQVGPEASVAPERMGGLERSAALQEVYIALSYQG
jgi:hypothetical protein